MIGKWISRLTNEEKLRLKLERSIRNQWLEESVNFVIQDGLYPLGVFQTFTELPDYDFIKIVQGIQVPILFLYGEFHSPNSKQEARFAAAAPDSRLEVIEETGHACSILKPEVFTQKVLEFARDIGWT